MYRAIASDEVAPGEGAFRTCSARSVCENTKSSTSRPARSTAWARTPANPGSTSLGRSSGTNSAAAATKLPPGSRWRASSMPVRQKRRAMR